MFLSTGALIHDDSCDLRCKLTVVAAFCGVTVVVAIIIVVRCWRRKSKPDNTCTKNVDRSLSLSALPSDYVDHENDRSRISPNGSMTSLEWSPHFVFPKIQVNIFALSHGTILKFQRTTDELKSLNIFTTVRIKCKNVQV